MSAAHEQGGANPVLQRADAAAECRLRDVAGIGGTREIAVLGECQEVSEPIEVHRYADPA